jgi:hypothetical protein
VPLYAECTQRFVVYVLLPSSWLFLFFLTLTSFYPVQDSIARL